MILLSQWEVKLDIQRAASTWMASQSALSRMTIYFDAMKTLHQTRQIDNYILGARSPSKVLLDTFDSNR